MPCLLLGSSPLLLVAVVPPDGEDFDDGDYFVLDDEVDQAVLVADVPWALPSSVSSQGLGLARTYLWVRFELLD